MMQVTSCVGHLSKRWHRSVARIGVVKTLIHGLFWHSAGLVWVNDLSSEFDVSRPSVPVQARFIESRQEFDSLGMLPGDLEWSGMTIEEFRDALRRGLMLFLLLTPEGRCVYVSWVVMRACGGELPYSFPVDYESEAATGGTITHPAFRRLGLYTFAHAITYRALRERGKKRVRLGPLEPTGIARRA